MKDELEELASEVFAAGNITKAEPAPDEDLESRVLMALQGHDGGWRFMHSHRAALLFIAQLLRRIADTSTPSNILMREALDGVRERLRLLMLDQPISGERETYTDGFFSGLAEAIGAIDSISVGGGVVVGEQGVTGDGLRPQPAGRQSPSPDGLGPTGDHQAQKEDE